LRGSLQYLFIINHVAAPHGIRREVTKVRNDDTQEERQAEKRRAFRFWAILAFPKRVLKNSAFSGKTFAACRLRRFWSCGRKAQSPGRFSPFPQSMRRPRRLPIAVPCSWIEESGRDVRPLRGKERECYPQQPKE